MTANLERVRFGIVGAMMALGLAGMACAGPADPASARAARAANASGDVIIGAAWPWAARKDILYWQGLQLGVEEINASGGIGGRNVRLVQEDDHESVNDGRLAAQRLAADPDVVAVIGHLQSYVTVPAAVIYDEAGIVMLAPTATDPELTRKGFRTVFRATVTDREIGAQMADFAHDAGYVRIAIIYIRNEYGRGIANAFEARGAALGLETVTRTSYDPSAVVTERSLATIADDWSRVQFDAIFLAGEVPTAALFIAEVRKAGITAPILGGDAMSAQALVSLGREAVEGTVVASVFHRHEPRAEVRTFVDEFQRRFAVPPDAGAAVGYDAIRLLAHAMRLAKTTVPDSVAKTLRAMPPWHGVTGPFSFNATGDLAPRPLVRLVVRQGRFEYLGAATLVSR